MHHLLPLRFTMSKDVGSNPGLLRPVLRIRIWWIRIILGSWIQIRIKVKRWKPLRVFLEHWRVQCEWYDLDPDPHQSEKRDPHQCEKRDPHQCEKRDPQHWLRLWHWQSDTLTFRQDLIHTRLDHILCSFVFNYIVIFLITGIARQPDQIVAGRNSFCRKGKNLFYAWKQCCGSMTFWGGSGSGSSDPCLWLMDLDPDSDPDPQHCLEVIQCCNLRIRF